MCLSLLGLILLLQFSSSSVEAKRLPRTTAAPQEEDDDDAGLNVRPKNYCFYKALQIPQGSSIHEVKSSYRALVKQYHPDKYQGTQKENARHIFDKIQEAYEILKQRETKEIYDKYGMSGFEAWEDGLDPEEYADEPILVEEEEVKPRRGGQSSTSGSGGGGRGRGRGRGDSSSSSSSQGGRGSGRNRDNDKQGSGSGGKGRSRTSDRDEDDFDTSRRGRSSGGSGRKRSDHSDDEGEDDDAGRGSGRGRDRSSGGGRNNKKENAGFDYGGGFGGGFNMDELLKSQQAQFKAFQAGGFGGAYGGGYEGYGAGYGGGGYGGAGGEKQPDLFKKKDSQVKRLKPKKFPSKQSNDMWLVLFYANDQPTSRDQANVLEKLAQKQSLAYRIGAIECTREQRNVEFCTNQLMDQYQSGSFKPRAGTYPIFAFVKDGKTKFMDGKVDNPSVKELHKFALEHMPKTSIEQITTVSQLQESLLRVRRKIKPGVLLLTDKTETSSMYYSLVYRFRNKINFGESHNANTSLAKKFNVEEYPQLISFVSADHSDEEYNDDFGIIRYTGGVQKEDIFEWLEQILVGSGGGGDDRSSSSRSRDDDDDDDDDFDDDDDDDDDDDEDWFGKDEL